MKKILSIILLLMVLILGGCGGEKQETQNEEGNVEVKNLDDVGGFERWEADGFPGLVRANISVSYPLGNIDGNKYAVYIGIGELHGGIIMQEDEKPVKKWEWLMEAEPYEETSKAYFNGILEYQGEEDSFPVFWISDVSEGDYINDAGEDNSIEGEVLTLPITVVNNTGIDIWEFYASSIDVDNWEEDILGDDILFDEESILINFTLPADQLIWDFAIVDGEGTSLEFYDMDFSNCSVNGATLTLYSDGTAMLE